MISMLGKQLSKLVSSITKLYTTFCDPMNCSRTGLPVPHHLSEFAQVHVFESVMLSNHLILCCPILLLSSVFPSIKVFSSESALLIRWPKYWSFSFSISPSNEYSGLISFRTDWLGYPCSPRDSQESSPTPPFKSINSSALSFHVGPSLTSIHDHWENHSFDYTELCRQRCLCFLICCLNFPSKEQVSFNFMAAVTVCSDFGVQENKVCLCFHCFPIYLP